MVYSSTRQGHIFHFKDSFSGKHIYLQKNMAKQGNDEKTNSEGNLTFQLEFRFWVEYYTFFIKVCAATEIIGSLDAQCFLGISTTCTYFLEMDSLDSKKSKGKLFMYVTVVAKIWSYHRKQEKIYNSHFHLNHK